MAYQDISTRALETGGNLASVKTNTDKIPSLGTATAANSVPVALPTATITTLTPPAAITGFATEAGNLASIKTAVETLDNAIAGSEMQVDVITLPVGHNIIDSGAVNATLAAETNKVIGTVNVAAGQSIGITANSAVNNAQVAGTAVSVNAGAKDAGTQRVTIATDQTAVSTAGVFSVKTDQTTHGTTDKVAADLNLVNGVALLAGAGNTGTGSPRVTIATDQVAVATKAASGAIASGAIASGAIASGAIASGALASGSIAVGAITAGNTSIATTEDTATAGGEHLIKNGIVRYDTPVSGANVSGSADWMPPIADSFGKAWITGTVPEDTAHVGGEAIMQGGVRRIDTAATSAGSSGDWATMDASAEGAIWATLTPTTTSGLSVGNYTSGDTYTALTNASQVIKASAGNLYGYYIFNPSAATAYVMIYNIASASVTVGTSTAQMVFAVPAGAAANVNFPYPISFSTAMSIAAATTGGGNSAPGTALEVMVYFK